ncbi:hypothetical protein D3C76_1425940 [compost metagenome]
MAIEVVLEQGERDYQRDQAGAVLFDQVLDLGFLVAVQMALEVAAEVLQHVAVAASGGALLQGRHQRREVARADLLRRMFADTAE